ncbi:MAG: hypothetical protein JXA25_08140 [Anaerolineales bacterium]|nr:hypothetical protein [Anaerolineales bacterium]
MRRYGWMLAVFLLLTGCAPAVSVEETSAGRPTTTPPPTATVYVTVEPEPTEVPPDALLAARNTFFTTSGICASCHTGSTDEAGADVSIDSQWRSTLMANAARDPYWQAELARLEITDGIDGAEAEAFCAGCHTPMASYSALQTGSQLELLGDGALAESHPEHDLAMDGVSCAVCHQITDANLGFPASYSGGYEIEEQSSAEGRSAFGSFEAAESDRAAMRAVSGFVPEQSQHLQQAEFCATCHTLYTPVYTSQGGTEELFPSQTPYFEWFYSEYRQTASCQDCHMPEAQGSVRLTNQDTPLRVPFQQHTFVGGNTYVLSILDAYQDDLQATASLQHFRRTYEALIKQLETDTAAVSLENSAIVDTWMRLDLLVENFAGHKFPTGYSSRRAWIHLRVTDAAGELVFESGAWEPSGQIQGDDFDETGVSYEPHYDQITSSDQVQIYETIPVDSAGEVTTVSLYAAARAKDNRLLPAGFNLDRAYRDFAIYSEAAEDENFLGGEDHIRYLFDTRGFNEPFTVQAELLFQPVGYRWITDMSGVEAQGSQQFLSYTESIPPVPEHLSSFTAEIVKGN